VLEGQVNVLNVRYALDSVVDPVTGKVVCRDVVAQAQGCVPINIFGLHSITPGAATYINAPENREAVIQEQVYSAVAQGPLFKLPAGDVITQTVAPRTARVRRADCNMEIAA
jgi:hypothetical protein